ncbi:MAG: hypothetical protein ACLTG4_02775 [Oscillospiraceae bacterium]
MRWSFPAFSAGAFYLELQDHGIPEQREVNCGLLRIAQETGLPARGDERRAHYLTREDSELQDVLLCIQTGKTPRRPGTACALRRRSST